MDSIIEAIRQESLGGGRGILKMDGIRRVVAGRTTLEEVLKVFIE